MSKTKSPPGYEESTLETLRQVLQQDYAIARAQERKLREAIVQNHTCITVTAAITLIAFLLTLGHIAYDLWRALK